MKRNYLILCLLFVINIIPVYGYFEYKYYCKVDQTKINVSLKNEQDFIKCFDLIESIKFELKTVSDNIIKSDFYINRGEDVDFWTGIKNQMQEKKKGLDILRTQVFVALVKFEDSIFDRLKKILDYHLNIKSLKLIGNKTYYLNNANLKMSDGDEQEYKNYLRKIEETIFELFLIDNIQKSQNFEEMIPVLRYRYKNYYIEI